jgi:hypothetical protein
MPSAASHLTSRKRATPNRCTAGDPALCAPGLERPPRWHRSLYLGGTHADRSKDESHIVATRAHSQRAASDCTRATPASAARQRAGTSLSSDHLADASSGGDGRSSRHKRGAAVHLLAARPSRVIREALRAVRYRAVFVPSGAARSLGLNCYSRRSSLLLSAELALCRPIDLTRAAGPLAVADYVDAH